MRILIADDEKDLLTALKERLEAKSHEVDIVFNGKDAVKLIDTNKYDLAFLDHSMPEITGLEIVKHIKKKGIKTKTVIITGYSAMKEVVAITVGADEYLEKPIKISDLENIIAKYSSC